MEHWRYAFAETWQFIIHDWWRWAVTIVGISAAAFVVIQVIGG